jgi:hypothetical protein
MSFLSGIAKINNNNNNNKKVGFFDSTNTKFLT